MDLMVVSPLGWKLTAKTSHNALASAGAFFIAKKMIQKRYAK
jgi:hypothetical protein